jgi:hypothetical protein
MGKSQTESSIGTHMNQTIACKNLLCSAIVLAIHDACKKNEYNSNSALHFLMTDSSDGYLDLLDIAPDHFRSALIKTMYSTRVLTFNGEKFKFITNKQRKQFVTNYETWLENHKLFKKGRHEY